MVHYSFSKTGVINANFEQLDDFAVPKESLKHLLYMLQERSILSFKVFSGMLVSSVAFESFRMRMK